MYDRAMRWPAVALIAVMIVCGGCAGYRPAARSFLIDPGTPPSRGGLAESAVSVRFARTATPFDSTQFVYRLSEDRWEKDPYNGFLTTPSEMMTRIIRKWARASFRAVAEPDESSKGRYVIECHLLELYGDFRDRNAPRAVFRIRLEIYERGGRQVAQRQSSVISGMEAFSERTPEALVTAWSKGLRRALPGGFARLRTFVR